MQHTCAALAYSFRQRNFLSSGSEIFFLQAAGFPSLRQQNHSFCTPGTLLLLPARESHGVACSLCSLLDNADYFDLRNLCLHF